MNFRARKHKRSEVKTYNQTVVNTVILVVVLVLFVYLALQLLSSYSAKVSTQRTQTYTDIGYFYFDGVIFKDSAPLYSDGDIVRYLAAEGEKIGVGQAYAEIYSDVSIPERDRAATEQRLNKLSDQILMLENGLEGAKGMSDLGSIQDSISDSYYAYTNAIASGDLSHADKVGAELFGSLVDYSSVTLSEAAENALAELRAERDDLISSIGGGRSTLVSDRSFTFSRRADGYEGILHTEKLADMSRSSLDDLLGTPADAVSGAVGSLIFSSKWYLAVPTDTAGYVMFSGSEGTVYEVELIGFGKTLVSMTLEGAFADEDDSESSYLLFSSQELMKAEGLERHQSVRVKMSSVSGYRIPSEAMHTLRGESGVYILVGNMIEFRRVTPIGEGDGYYIVNTYEKDLEEGTPTETPYLGINDLIITSGRDLYDGKLLD